MTWWNRFRRRERLDEDLDKELRFHVDQYTDDLVANGHTPAAGAPRGKARARRSGAIEGRLPRRPRHALARRSVARLPLRPANTWPAPRIRGGGPVDARPRHGSQHRDVHADQLRPAEAAGLSGTGEARDGRGRHGAVRPEYLVLSYPDYLDLKRDTHTFEQLAAWNYGGGGTITSPGEPEWLLGREISSDIFRALRIPLEQGRAFLPDEDRRGGAPVAIISHRLWQRRFSEEAQRR